MGWNLSYKAVKFIDSTHEVLRSYNRPKTSKRKRTKLSEEQLNILEESYQLNHHPSSEIKETMALKIGIPVKNIQIWFQNRRAKDKSIKEHILTESRKRQEGSYTLLYQRSNTTFLPRGSSLNTYHIEQDSTVHEYGICKSSSRNSHESFNGKRDYYWLL